MLLVNDIFYSIQGESSFAGYPCVFVRLGGCNLKCSYCDTKDALIGVNSINMDISDIIKKINEIGGKTRLIEITGGEPLIQEGVYKLFSELIALNYLVLLETNGTINLRKVPEEVVKIVDIKCPSSNFCDKNNYKNIDYITANDELKFVIGTEEDYIFAKYFLKKHFIKTQKVIFSTVDILMTAKDLAMMILRDKLNVRLGVQIHKLLKLK